MFVKRGGGMILKHPALNWGHVSEKSHADRDRISVSCSERTQKTLERETGFEPATLSLGSGSRVCESPALSRWAFLLLDFAFR